MMPGTVAALAAGSAVSVAALFEFQFASHTWRFWDGIGTITAGAHEWLGFGQMISVSGLEQGRGMTAGQATFVLSGVDSDLVALAVNSANEVTGRPCGVYLQFRTDAGEMLDSPVSLWQGSMDVMSFSIQFGLQEIRLAAEGLFVGRIRTPFGLLTDRDQQLRWPADAGLEFMASLRFKTVNWLRG